MPQPAPGPARPKASRPWGKWLLNFVVFSWAMGITAVNGLIVYEWTGNIFADGHEVRVGVQLGKHYAPKVLEAEAQAWDASAAALRANKTIEEWQAATKQARHDWLTKGYKEVVQPSMQQVVPEGDPLTDPAKRQFMIDRSDGLAKGLRKKKHGWFGQ